MITINAFDLLKSIGTSQKAFGIVEADVEKAALAIMQKLMKAKNLTVLQLREVCRAIGSESLGIVIDNLADKDVSGLIKKLDKLWPEIKTAQVDQQRERVLSLATGRIEPAAKAPVAPRATRPAAPKAKKADEPAAQWSKSMSARHPNRN